MQHFRFPILEIKSWYQKGDIVHDLIAGITVAVVLIPQGLAYALLAGVPPIYGLYAAVVPLFIYALFGTSRQLAVGPTALMSLLIASAIAPIAETVNEYIQLVFLVALLAGVIQLLFGILKMGFLINFVSRPVISGFTSAAAIIIVFSQLKYVLNIDISTSAFLPSIQNLILNAHQYHFDTVILSAVAILLLLGIKKINKRLPAAVIVVVFGILLSYLMDFNAQNIVTLGEIPAGLPIFLLPDFNMQTLWLLLPGAFTIAMVSFMESYAVAKALEIKHNNSYKINPNQELVALGFGKFFGAFFQAFPTSGGFSRSAVNNTAGAKSTVASLITVVFVIISLLFFTTVFSYLPIAILAAIIIVAALKMINLKTPKNLWSYDKLDFISFLLSFLATLFIGVIEGIGLGVLFSLILVLRRLAYPHLAELGKVPDAPTFRNIYRFDDLIIDDSILILRLDAQLFFGNCDRFMESVERKIKNQAVIKVVIIEAVGIHNIDSSSIHMLFRLHDFLKSRQIRLLFSEVKGPLREKFYKNKVFDRIGTDQFFLTTLDAWNHIRENRRVDQTYYTLQVNQI